MLIAEIKGKAVPELEGIEDLITSSVFGHLRLVPPSGFWADFFARAKTVDDPARSLTESLMEHSIALSAYQRLDMRFWGNFDTYGEPDLLLCFSGGDQEPLLVLIEVKLNSGKSSVGEKDQLAKYMGLIDDPGRFAVWPSKPHLRTLVYLTRAFASDDLCDSAKHCHMTDAKSRMFGMEWNDVLEVSAAHSKDNFLLGEVRDFLRRRGLERFAGFSPVLLPELPPGAFYGSVYFGDITIISGSSLEGGFYEQGVQMGLAMKAIINLHQDCIKLISDIDKHMQGYESFYGTVVTQGLGSAISNRKYIADGLMRHYHRTGNQSEMLGVNICFYDLNDPKFVEPILVVARTTYVPMEVDYAEKYRRAWDPWYSFLSWAPTRTYGEAISLSTPKNRETIFNLTVAALPLYEVKTLTAAVGLIELVGMPQ